MEFTNLVYRWVQADDGPHGPTLDAAVDALLLVMAPAAPHLCAELWEARNGGHVHEQPWPEADPAKLVDDTVTMVVQVNGKVRDRLEVPADLDESGAEAAALASDKVAALLDGAVPRKVIARPPKLVNLVV
jgi:leucyl-tRNA synthetase